MLPFGLSQFKPEAHIDDVIAGGISQWQPLGSIDLEQPERDQGKPHEDPREEKPPFPSNGYDRTQKVKSAHDLLVPALEGGLNGGKGDDAAHYAYEARFEENVDGRRRVVVEVSQVVQREIDGVPTKHVETDYFYVGKDGDAAFEDSKPHPRARRGRPDEVTGRAVGSQA